MTDTHWNPARVAVQTAALIGFLHYISGDDRAWAAFTADTGIAKPSAPRNGLDKMIDDATGFTESVTRKFVAWAINNLWGADEVPPGMRRLCDPDCQGAEG